LLKASITEVGIRPRSDTSYPFFAAHSRTAWFCSRLDRCRTTAAGPRRDLPPLAAPRPTRVERHGGGPQHDGPSLAAFAPRVISVLTRCDKDTGFGRFPSRIFTLNQAWLELALTAIDLLAWTQHIRSATRR
jgi:hypothetical protein